jgi:hypothetical protein
VNQNHLTKPCGLKKIDDDQRPEYRRKQPVIVKSLLTNLSLIIYKLEYGLMNRPLSASFQFYWSQKTNDASHSIAPKLLYVMNASTDRWHGSAVPLHNAMAKLYFRIQLFDPYNGSNLFSSVVIERATTEG